MTKSSLNNDEERNEESNSRENPCGSKDPKRVCCGCTTLLLLIVGVSILSASLKRLASTEIGLEYNVHKKKLADAAASGGLHAGPPGFKFIKFPSTFVTTDLPLDTCVSQDGLRIEYVVTFQYQMPEEWLLPAILRYRNFDTWATVVTAAGNSAVQHTCSEFSVSNFQNKRGIIQSTMQDNVRLKLEGNGQENTGVYAKAISLQLRNVKLPSEYEEAVEEKQEAAEDIELAKNQRNQEITRAETELLTAQEEAKRINQTAIHDSNIILQEANLKADEISFSFSTEADVIVSVRDNLGLTTEGILAYMANRLYEAVGQLKVSAAEPAKLSRKDELSSVEVEVPVM